MTTGRKVLPIAGLVALTCGTSLLTQDALATTLWEEAFDGFSQDWICALDDCALDPGLPPGFVGFGSNTLCGNYGEPNAQLTADAERTGAAGLQARGFRIYLEEECWPTGDNLLQVDLGADHTLVYLRWYQRDSVNVFDNFQKLFRLHAPVGGQILIPEWQGNAGHVQMNLWDAQTQSNHFFAGYDLDVDYVPGTWACYELKLDLVSKQAEFWVDGVSIDGWTAGWWPDGWAIRRVTVGGNQYGHTWSAPVEETRDYDDIVLADEYVGPAGTAGTGGAAGVAGSGGDGAMAGAGGAGQGGAGGGAGDGAGGTGTATGGSAAGSPTEPSDEGGCGCRVGGTPGLGVNGIGLAAALAGVASRRRRGPRHVCRFA